MEFIETPTFWYPDVDHTACTNFSTRTVELRPSERWEILPLPFSLSFPFLTHGLFSFSFVSLHFSSLSFLFTFLFFFLISLLLWNFLSHLDHYLPYGSNEEISSSFPHTICVAIVFPLFFIPFYDIIFHMANSEPHIQVHHMALLVSLSWGPIWYPLITPFVI